MYIRTCILLTFSGPRRSQRLIEQRKRLDEQKKKKKELVKRSISISLDINRRRPKALTLRAIRSSTKRKKQKSPLTRGCVYAPFTSCNKYSDVSGGHYRQCRGYGELKLKVTQIASQEAKTHGLYEQIDEYGNNKGQNYVRYQVEERMMLFQLASKQGKVDVVGYLICTGRFPDIIHNKSSRDIETYFYHRRRNKLTQSRMSTYVRTCYDAYRMQLRRPEKTVSFVIDDHVKEEQRGPRPEIIPFTMTTSNKTVCRLLFIYQNSFILALI